MTSHLRQAHMKCSTLCGGDPIVVMKHVRSTAMSGVDDRHAMRTFRKLWPDFFYKVAKRFNEFVTKGQYLIKSSQKVIKSSQKVT